jgi:hypothetical protein
MKVKFYKDGDFEVNLEKVVSIMNSISRYITFEYSTELVQFDKNELISPISYSDKLSENIHEESKNYFAILIFTNNRYYNNFFFETVSNIFIISFADWNLLTNISKNIGVIFFMTSILCCEMHIGKTHDKSIGCINDFWWDKRSIDVGMRSAYLCADCKNKFQENTPNKFEEQILNDISIYLDLISKYSRAGKDILEMDLSAYYKNNENIFDVFLCHNSADKPLIREIGNQLKKIGITVWLDEEQIRHGTLWQVELEKNIANIKSALVFVGRDGFGPWQNMEIRALLSEFVNRGYPVIPVILKNCKTVPELPLFLKQMMWVDMRKSNIDSILQMKWGITGKNENPSIDFNELMGKSI